MKLTVAEVIALPGDRRPVIPRFSARGGGTNRSAGCTSVTSRIVGPAAGRRIGADHRCRTARVTRQISARAGRCGRARCRRRTRRRGSTARRRPRLSPTSSTWRWWRCTAQIKFVEVTEDGAPADRGRAVRGGGLRPPGAPDLHRPEHEARLGGRHRRCRRRACSASRWCWRTLPIRRSQWHPARTTTAELLEDWERRSRLRPASAARTAGLMTAVGPRGEEWGRLIVPRAAADTGRAHQGARTRGGGARDGPDDRT